MRIRWNGELDGDGAYELERVIRSPGGKPDYAGGSRKLVERNRDGTRAIKRDNLISHDGRWGLAKPRYSGRNYHFYSALVESGYWEEDFLVWQQRYYGDGWDRYFEWELTSFFPQAYLEPGVVCFEP